MQLSTPILITTEKYERKVESCCYSHVAMPSHIFWLNTVNLIALGELGFKSVQMNLIKHITMPKEMAKHIIFSHEGFM